MINNTIGPNECDGIRIENADGNILYRNKLISNAGAGVHIGDLANGTLWSNILINDGLDVSLSNVSQPVSDIPENNTVNGNPIFFRINKTGITLNSTSVGQIILLNCSGGEISNVSLSKTDTGIYLFECTDVNVSAASLDANNIGMAIVKSDGCRFSNCSMSYNKLYGVHMFEASNTTISFCNISKNNIGASLSRSAWNLLAMNNFTYNKLVAITAYTRSENNTVYKNNFIGNNGASSTYDPAHRQVADQSAKNSWDSGYAGNYWYDWITPDNNGDGIVDNPYIIQDVGSARDNFPLVHPVSESGTWVPEFSGGSAFVFIAVVFLSCISATVFSSAYARNTRREAQRRAKGKK